MPPPILDSNQIEDLPAPRSRRRDRPRLQRASQWSEVIIVKISSRNDGYANAPRTILVLRGRS